MSTYKGRGLLQITGTAGNGPVLGISSAVGNVATAAQHNKWLVSNGNSAGAGLHWFEDQASEKHVKKYEVFEVEEDILLLSVVWQRMRKQREDCQKTNNSSVLPFEMPTNITSGVLFRNITQGDRDRTTQLRDYYHKKLMMWTLNEIRLSNFRQDLKKLLQSDGKIFQENMKPLAYRMPEFYDYDLMFDEMFFEHNTQVKQERQIELKTKHLKLVKTVARKRRHSQVKEFWFSDENNNLNRINISKDNPLLSLMEYHAKNPIKVQGQFYKNTQDNRDYCVVEKYSFL